MATLRLVVLICVRLVLGTLLCTALDIMYLRRNVCSHPLSGLRLGYLAVLKTELALRDLNYILDSSPLSVICLENISSHFNFFDIL